MTSAFKDATSPGRQQRAHHLSKEMLSDALKLYDAVAVLAAAVLSCFGYLDAHLGGRGRDPEIYPYAALLAAAATVSCLQYAGAYRYQTLRDIPLQCRQASAAWVAVSALGLLIGFLTKTSELYSRGFMVTWFTVALLLLCGGRLMLRPMIGAWQRQ